MSEVGDTELPPAKKQKVCDERDSPENEQPADIDFTEDNIEAEDKFTMGEKFENFVTPEEMEKLREFKVLDEVKSNDEDSNDEESDSSDGGNSEGLPEEEIEKMLDEDLPEDFKAAPKPKEKPYVTRTKIVLEEKGVNQFEILPLDWMMVRHYSGMPVYMHRTTRVCTLSKPYFLGKGNTRRHDIPISAIPCLAYRRALVEEEKQKEIDRRVEEQIKNQTWLKTHLEKNNASQINKETPAQTNETSNGDNNTEVTEKEQDVSTSDKPNKCPFSHFRKSVDENSETTTSNDPVTETNENADNTAGVAASEIETNAPVETDNATMIEVEINPLGNIGDIKEENTNSVDCSIKTEKESVDAENNESQENDETQKTTEEASEAFEIPIGRQPVILPGGKVMPAPRVENINSSWKTQHLTPNQINDYCKKLFKFKAINIMHFKRWADRRKYTKARKTLQYPTLPEGTKLITIPAQNNGQENGGKGARRDWVMNMNGRSYLSVFHEYVCRALQKQPVYEYKQLENASTPYQATVYIGDMQYGVGRGSSKRQAKYAAARASIHILIPEMRDYLEPPAAGAASAEPDFTFFDYVGIEDPRIAEFCAATCEPSPHAILRTCLLRNFGAGDRHIQTEMKKLEYEKIELTMKVGKHSATVVCKNKKTAKQRASQAILQALHPHVRSWGSLLRLYGSRSVKSCKEKKLEEQQITLLQDKARRNEPNHAVLRKLRAEMSRLRARDAAVLPVGTLRLEPAAALPACSASALNTVDL